MRHLLLVAGLAVAGSAAAQETPIPPEIAAFTEQSLAECRGAGGTPALSGLAFPGAEPSDGQLPPFLTEVELNGDGKADFVTDLAGLDCVNAWSYFCGSAGCPVTVWLSGPDGLAPGWGGHAQAWELRGTEVILYLHGQMCSPPRPGVEGCEETLRFGAAAEAPADASAPVPPGALASSPRPRPRPGVPAPAPSGAAAAPGAPADPPGAVPEPAAPVPAPPPVPLASAPWTSGEREDGAGWFARVEDPESGARIDWLCAKGTESRLAITPHPGGEAITIDVDGRVQSFAVEVEGSTAYTPVAIGAPVFLHIASGRAFSVLDPAGAPAARFTMEGAPLAIGQAEGRCQF